MVDVRCPDVRTAAVAYSDYADIIDAQPGDSETSYADMAAGLAPLIGTPPTLLWDTAGGRLHINKTTAPYAWTLMHTYFPATDLGGMSAALGAYSSRGRYEVDVGLRVVHGDRYESSQSAADGVPVRNTSPEYTLGTTESRYELVNVQPPATALYGRLLVMVSNTVAHDTSLSWALIEDSPYPENYFNGTNNDGDDGDFFFATGKGYVGDAAPHLSPSVYYQRFRRFASGVGGADALTQLMPVLLALPALLQGGHCRNRVVQRPGTRPANVPRSWLRRQCSCGVLAIIALITLRSHALHRRQGLRLPALRGDGGGSWSTSSSSAVASRTT